MTEDQLLQDIRDAYQADDRDWQAIRAEGDTDMLCVAGQMWDALDPKGKAQRTDAKRPYLSLDELSQYTNQLINEVRANKRGVKVDAIGYGADAKTAEFRQNLIRQIEYRSNAQQAYTTMFENAVQRSFGWLRIRAKYVSIPDPKNPQSSDLDQELLIEPIVNPNLVIPDSRSVRSDGSDMRRLTVIEEITHAEFKRLYSGAKVTNFSAELQQSSGGWVKDSTLLLGDHWRIDTKTRLLLFFKTADEQILARWQDEIGEGENPGENFREREVEFPAVKQHITNGVEILKRTNWPGQWIPFVPCYGKVLYLTEGGMTVKKIISLPRLARDPAMLYCYYRTQEAEIVGMIPKAPVQAYEGQLDGYEEDWKKAAREPVAYLYFKGHTEATGPTILPPPSRLNYESGQHLQALEVSAEGARRAIQAAIGSTPLPTSAQRQNEKSGIALREINSSTQRGSFHFIDHYDEAITRTGAILDDLAPHYYDTTRDVTVRDQKGDAQVVRINDEQDPGSIWLSRNGRSVGQHDVTISTGPSNDSQREAAKDFADAVAQNPVVFPRIADLVVKLKQLGPLGDEIADRLTPPEFRKPADGQAPDPAQMQQELAQAKGQMQQLMTVAQKLAHDKEVDQAKQDGAVRLKQMDIDFQREKAQRDSETKIAVAELGAKVDRLQLFLEERARLGVEQAQAAQADQARQHEIAMSVIGHSQSQEQADQAHQQALEQGQVSSEQQMAMQTAQAEQAAQNAPGGQQAGGPA